MTRPARIETANDNHVHLYPGVAAHVVSLPVVPVVPDIQTSAPAAPRPRPSPLVRRVSTLITLWASVFAAAIYIQPLMFHSGLLAVGLFAALLTLAAATTRSPLWLGLGALTTSAAALLVAALPADPALHTLHVAGALALLGALGMLQAALAIRLRSDAAGACLMLGLAVALAGALGLLGQPTPMVVAATAILAVASVGATRSAAARRIAGARGAYACAWALATLAAAAFAVSALPLPSVTPALAAGTVAALAVWLAHGLRVAVQGTAMLALALLATVPTAAGWLSERLQLFTDESVFMPLTLAALLAASVALAARGMLRSDRLFMSLGAVFAGATTFLLLDPNSFSLNTALLAAIAFSAMTAWLLAARLV